MLVSYALGSTWIDGGSCIAADLPRQSSKPLLYAALAANQKRTCGPCWLWAGSGSEHMWHNLDAQAADQLTA